MAITETQRTTLYRQLTDAIGQEAARTLMEQLPPERMGPSRHQRRRQGQARGCLPARAQGPARKLLHGELKETEGRLMLQIADSESRPRRPASTERTPASTKPTPASTERTPRLDETSRELSELKGEVKTGFAGLQLTLARQHAMDGGCAPWGRGRRWRRRSRSPSCDALHPRAQDSGGMGVLGG